MADNIAVQCLAFAAVCQSALLIQRLSRFGSWDIDGTEDAALTLIKSIRVENPRTAYDVFDDVALRRGYQVIVDIFGGINSSDEKTMELTKYLFSFLNLGSKVFKDSAMLNALDEAFKKLEGTYLASECTPKELDPEYLRGLATIYKELISKSSYGKILIMGNRTYLQQEDIQCRIRSLLIAAIRAVVLWRQLGGRRLKLFFGRKNLLAYATQHLKNL